MELMGQENNEKDVKLKKIIKISLIISVVLLIIVAGLMIFLQYQDSKQLKLYVDRTKTKLADDLLIFDENSDKIYVSIKDMAKLAGYEYYNGDYNQLTEEQNKCYVNNKKEVAGFELGSNQMYKADPTSNSKDYDWYTIDDPVRTVNGKLYVTSKAIQKACNISFTYNKEKNRIEVLTLPYLVSSYEAIAINNYGYAGLDDNYQNQKAILYNMLVVKKQEAKDKFIYGVISLDNKAIIGTKYTKIEYIEIANDFYVTIDKKVGIMSNEGAQKIEPSYDTIKVLDNDTRLYYVKNGNLCGVLDRNGKRVLYLEYSQIGVDSSLYPSNKIKNSMFLFDNCIPVMKNGKWGIFDKNGNQLLDVVYDSLGYINGTKKDASANNLLIIPEIEGIVVCLEGKYGIVNSTGKMIVTCAFDRIYSVTNLGEDKFYLETNGQTMEVKEYIKYMEQQNATIQPNQIEEYNTLNTNTLNQNTSNTNALDNGSTVVAPTTVDPSAVTMDTQTTQQTTDVQVTTTI